MHSGDLFLFALSAHDDAAEHRCPIPKRMLTPSILHTHRRLRILPHSHAHARTCTHIHTHTQKLINIYTYTCLHTHTHTHTHSAQTHRFVNDYKKFLVAPTLISALLVGGVDAGPQLRQ